MNVSVFGQAACSACPSLSLPVTLDNLWDDFNDKSLPRAAAI